MKLKSQVKKTLRKIKLSKKKKILVALSGGKDSAAVGFVLKKLGYRVEGLHLDLGVGDYSKKCLDAVEKLCSDYDIPLHVYSLKAEMNKTMKNVWVQTRKKGLNNCAACGIFKKWIMNKKSRELRFDYVVTGHNLDDEAQTFLMNILKGSPKLSANVGAITRNKSDKKFVPRVKPLFYVLEEDVLSYAKKNKLPFISGKCPYAETSYRIEIRENFLKDLSEKEKRNIIKNFEKLRPRMEKLKIGETKLSYCEVCGEPCRGKICKMCAIVK
jgi:tRNA-5-methyluridine54 2-sulfurtransferase